MEKDYRDKIKRRKSPVREIKGFPREMNITRK